MHVCASHGSVCRFSGLATGCFFFQHSGWYDPFAAVLLRMLNPVPNARKTAENGTNMLMFRGFFAQR